MEGRDPCRNLASSHVPFPSLLISVSPQSSLCGYIWALDICPAYETRIAAANVGWPVPEGANLHLPTTSHLLSYFSRRTTPKAKCAPRTTTFRDVSAMSREFSFCSLRLSGTRPAAPPTVASELAESMENWGWLHSACRPFCKASQLNDAVDWARTVWGRGARYVIYDIDGRPEHLTLLPVDGCFADIEQQVPLPTHAPDEAPSAIGRGHAAVQCVRVFGQEVYTWASAQERSESPRVC